jgi:hypothetical protein
MAIRTLESLEAALTEDLKWRTAELDNWESMISGCRPHQVVGAVRGGIALLYAHWEGYVKEAARAYLEYVSRKGLTVGQLRDELAAIALRSLIGKGEQSKKAADHTVLVSTLRNELSEKAYLPYQRATIRTRSNLSFDTFADIMHSIGCDVDKHALQKGLIDNRLLKNRNDVAHGRELLIDFEDWCQMRERVVYILRDVRAQLQSAAAMEAYRRPGSQT